MGMVPVGQAVEHMAPYAPLMRSGTDERKWSVLKRSCEGRRESCVA